MIFRFTDAELTQLRTGDIDGFKNTLINHNCTRLELDAYLQNETRAFFVNLGQALQGLPIVSLYMQDVKIAEHAPYFAEALQGSNLESLTIKRGKIGDNASTFVHNLIGTKVKRLNLEQNNIGQHALHLMQTMAKSNLESLDLNCNEIGANAPAVASAVHSTKLKFLGLANNAIGVHAPAVVTALQPSNLTSIDLSGNQIYDEEVCKALGAAFKGTTIKSVDLNSNSMGKSAAALVKALIGSPVEKLGLGYNHIGVDTAAVGESTIGTRLRALDLECNDITGEIAIAFAKAIHGSNLKSLDMSINLFSNNPSFVKLLPGTVSSLRITTTNEGAPALVTALQGTTIREIYADTAIGSLSTDNQNLIRNAILENRRQNLRVDSLVAGFELAKATKEAKVTLPNDVVKMIARRMPNQSNNPVALARFLSGFEAAVNPTDNDSIKAIKKAPVVEPVIHAPVLQVLAIHAANNQSFFGKAWAKVTDFAQTPSKYPASLGTLGGIFLMSALSLAVTLSSFATIIGAFVLTGAIIGATKLRNKLVDDAVQNNDLLISANLPVSAVCDEGMKASNSWTLYFKSFASLNNWKEAADFGAGMKMQANKKPGI